MITAIEIENFKGIGNRVRIDLRPITLLFGANSSGKSTIIHALHYAREILFRGNLDADRTETGGDLIDLGGFLNFIHNRDLNREISLGFEMSVPDGELLPYFGRTPDQPFGETTLDFLSHVKEVAVDLRMAWSQALNRPFVKRYAVSLDNEPAGVITASPDSPGQASLHVERWHPWLNARSDEEDADAPTQWQELVDRALPNSPLKWFELLVESRSEALPDFDSGLSCPRLFEDIDDDQGKAADAMMRVLSRAIVGPGGLLRDTLARLRYLGPLREKPARNYEAPRFPDASRWASGIAAWDRLYADAGHLVDEVGDWMSDSARLATGCRLYRQEYKEIDVADPSIVRLIGNHPFDDADLTEVKQAIKSMPSRRRLYLVDQQTGEELFPHDVGEGISQIVPVIVGVLASGASLTMIEQPELHVHPGVQVGLGDLLIEGACRERNVMLVETHSEHLILRLLRRLRETNERELPPDHRGLTPTQLSVLFLESTDDGIRVTPLEVDKAGEFVDRWPRGFFEERAGELF